MSGSAHATAAARHGGNPILRVIGWISQACGVVAALMIVVSVLIVCQMIFIRFVLNQSTIWHTEGVTYLMIGATMLGLPYVQYVRGHVNVDLLPIMIPNKARRVLAGIVMALTLAVVGMMLWHGYHFWHEARLGRDVEHAVEPQAVGAVSCAAAGLWPLCAATGG